MMWVLFQGDDVIYSNKESETVSVYCFVDHFSVLLCIEYLKIVITNNAKSGDFG